MMAVDTSSDHKELSDKMKEIRSNDKAVSDQGGRYKKRNKTNRFAKDLAKAEMKRQNWKKIQEDRLTHKIVSKQTCIDTHVYYIYCCSAFIDAY